MNLMPPTNGDRRAAPRQSEMLGYLLISAGSGVLEFVFRAAMRDAGRPAIVVRRHDRHLEVAVQLWGPLLFSDVARNACFDLTLAASLPGAMVLASNARLLTTRIAFGPGYDLAKRLREAVEDPANLEVGTPREWARCEALIRADGTVRYRRRGVTRPLPEPGTMIS